MCCAISDGNWYLITGIWGNQPRYLLQSIITFITDPYCKGHKTWEYNQYTGNIMNQLLPSSILKWEYNANTTTSIAAICIYIWHTLNIYIYTSLTNAKLFSLSLQTPAAVTDAAKRKAAFGMDGSEVSPPWSSKTSRQEEVEAIDGPIDCPPNKTVTSRIFVLLMY